MPRGKPRRGQYVVELVMPDGARIKFETTKDLDVETWCASLSRVLTQVVGIVERVRRKSADPVAREGVL